VLETIKLLEGIGNGGNCALMWSTAILWTNDQHFILLRYIGVYRKLSPIDHLWIYILCPCWHAICTLHTDFIFSLSAMKNGGVYESYTYCILVLKDVFTSN